ncbi:MAG: DUF4258 domain-containing protein [Anaerolineae bacterium]|nr:DUF4258 domain-containing protein [Anaerolineae bacterium]
MSNLPPIKSYILTDHARFEMARRQISEDTVAQVLGAPEYTEVVRPGRALYQSRWSEASKTFLIRIFVDIDREPPKVVTVYRTSKIAKYWRAE